MAWQWTARATSTSPIPATTRSRSGTPRRRRSPPWFLGAECPQGVAVDGAGNVYIADTGNKAIEGVERHDADGHHPGLLGAEWAVWRGGGRGGQRLHRRYWQQCDQGVERHDPDGHHPGLFGAKWCLWRGGGRGGQCLHSRFRQQRGSGKPRAFVPGGPVSEGPAAGSDQLPLVLPTTEVADRHSSPQAATSPG